jgi:hypothetical protein
MSDTSNSVDPSKHRESKKWKIRQHYAARIGQPQDSQVEHGRFGSSFRARVSEINADSTCPFRIVNTTICTAAGEVSHYVSVWKEKSAQQELFDVLPEQPRDEG